MILELLPMPFTVCQTEEMPLEALSAPFAFFARTDEELSLVCPESQCPARTLNREDGWRCLRVQGSLDFSLVGILARIAGCLAEAKVPIFAVSTYNTDYVLFRQQFLNQALDALDRAEFSVDLSVEC